MPSLVICRLLGVPYSHHGFFQANSKVVIKRDATPGQRHVALGNLSAYLEGLVGEKLTDPGDDLLSVVAERVKSGELTESEAAQMGVLLLIAGHETTANMIALGTLALLRHPDQLKLLRETDDPELVSSAVEELLRYLHITHNGRRRFALEDIEIAGETIRAGDGLIMANDMGNRDPRVFPEPDRLDITRGNRKHVASLYRRLPGLRLARSWRRCPSRRTPRSTGSTSCPSTGEGPPRHFVMQMLNLSPR